MKKIKCTHCGEKSEFEPDEEFGLTYEQSHGTCLCGGYLVYENGERTKEAFTFVAK